jgi:hypothetical protein
MTAIKRALGHSLEQTESRHHRARWKDLDLEVAAGHVVHLLGVIQCIFVKDIFGRPSALPPHGDRAGLRLGDHGGGHSASSNGNAFEQTTTTGCFAISQEILQEL